MNRPGDFRQLQRGETSAFQSGRILSIKFEEPETCPFLRDVLQTIKNGSANKKLCALDDLACALPLPTTTKDQEKAVGAAVYVLEQGVLPVLLEGLERAAYNRDWLEAESDPNNRFGALRLRSKIHIYCRVLERLIHDTRSTSYILKHAPTLLETLQKLYSIDSMPFPNLPVSTMKTMIVDARDYLQSVLISLLKWSKKAQKWLARTASFVNTILQSALENFSTKEHVDNGLTLLVMVCPVMEARTFDRLADLCLDLVARVLAKSCSRNQIELVLLFFGKLSSFHFETFSTKFIPNISILRSVITLFVCPDIHPLHRGVSLAILRSNIKRRVGVVVDEEGFRDMVWRNEPFSAEEDRALQEVVLSMGTLPARVMEIRQVFEREPESSFLRNLESSRQSSASEGAEQEAPASKRPPRKCAAAGCQKFETQSGEFQLCSRCKLTAYCSKECQTKAWKAGHKVVCNK